MYFGRWKSHDSMKDDWFPSWRNIQAPEDFPDEADILFAAYEGGDYKGSAIVVYVRKSDGMLMEVNGGHCSCYGLEGQWEPEETSLEALRMRRFDSYELNQADIVEIVKILGE